MTSELRDQLQASLGDAYELGEELGGGGMSRVFVAEDTATRKRVAIKLLAPELATGVNLERFRREIQVAQELDHPGIVPVLSVGHSSGILYYTMPFVEGESLRALLQRERQLPFDEALRITRDIAAALTYASGKNIVHRDIKPENILLDRGGRAAVTDFGIARAVERSADLSSLTSTGLTLGTPTYMSPEQAVGDRFIDGRSDVYSLGCVLYEMLAGEPPFTGPNAQTIIARHVHEQPRPLRIVRPELSAGVESVIERALAKTPAARYKTGNAFVDALEHPAASTEPAGTPRWRRRWWVVAAGIPVIALVGLGVLLPRFWDTAARPPVSNLRVDPRRVAVLDFEDQSPDKNLGHIASGLTGSLIRELTGAAAIQVVSRNSVRTFRERGLSFDSLVTALRIGSLVEGSVQRSNDLLRITVQLVDADAKTHLESVTIERPMGELFMLEDELARQVAGLLRRRIGDEVRIRETTAGTRSARARELVFRAENLRADATAMVASADTEEVSAASEMLKRADSVLAAAQAADRRWTVPATERGWVALALAQHDSGSTREEAFARAVRYANDVLAQEPGNAGALQLRGATAYWTAARLQLPDSAFRRMLGQARADLAAAVSADSTLAAAWGTLGLVHVALGEVTLARRAARTALAMDSYLEEAPTILLALYGATLMNGSMAEAWQWCERGGRDYPADHRFLDCRLTLLAEDEGRVPDAPQTWALVARANELDPPARARATGRPWLPIYRLMMGAVVSARAGDRDSARAVARRARALAGADRELRTDLAYEEAYLHLVLGEPRSATASLGAYLAERPSLKDLVSRHPRWRPLRSDTTFLRLVGRATPGRS